jgi:hypothetical protein
METILREVADNHFVSNFFFRRAMIPVMRKSLIYLFIKQSLMKAPFAVSGSISVKIHIQKQAQ